MSGPSFRYRLLARLMRHATQVMPSTHAAWADAMQSEFEHIQGGPDALAWVAGCVVASYGTRLADLWTRHARRSLRRLAASCVAVMVIGYASENRACGQTPHPAFTDTACELPHITLDRTLPYFYPIHLISKET